MKKGSTQKLAGYLDSAIVAINAALTLRPIMITRCTAISQVYEIKKKMITLLHHIRNTAVLEPEMKLQKIQLV